MFYTSLYARIYEGGQNLKKTLRRIFKYPEAYVYGGLFVVFLIGLSWQAYFIKQNLLGDLVILHYNVDFGVDLMATKGYLTLYPLAFLLVFLINFLIVWLFNRSQNLRKYLNYLLATALLVAIFISLALLSIYLINFR
ncbi:MAG: hypothetical protein ACOX0C_01800 [Patescibacteria group bacterium]|jgi:hypothetical protein